MKSLFSRSALQLSVRTAVAAGVSLAIAKWAHLGFPLYAVISAVIVSDLSPGQTRHLSLQRIAGTVLGAGLGAMLSPTGLNGPLTVGSGILISILLCHLFRIQGAAKLSAYTCAIVLMEHGAHPWSYAFFRLLETVLGIAVAVGVSLVPKLMAGESHPSKDA